MINGYYIKCIIYSIFLGITGKTGITWHVYINTNIQSRIYINMSDAGFLLCCDIHYFAILKQSKDASQSFHTGSLPKDLRAFSISTAVLSSLIWNCSNA